MSPATPLVEFENVAVGINGTTLFSNLSFAIQRGTFVCLRGQTGCGKSLILKLIAGIISPSEGKVRIAGDAINDLSDTNRQQIRHFMGFMSQESLLLNDRSVFENVMLPALAAGASYREAKRHAQEAIEHCQIQELSGAQPQELSHGQRQIACLARAVVNSPKIILADEPAAHLDVVHAQQLMNLLGEFALGGTSVIVASHLDILPQDVCVEMLQLTPNVACY